MGRGAPSILEESKIDYPSQVLFVADDPGVFGAFIVDIEHVDIEGVLVARQEYAVSGPGSAILTEAELGIVEIEICSGRDGDGILTYHNGYRFDGGMRVLTIDAAVIGFAVDAQQMTFLHHELVFGRQKEASPDDDLDIVIRIFHEIRTVVYHRQRRQLRFPDAFIHRGEREAGDIRPDILLVYFGEIILFLTKIRVIQILRTN